MSKYIDADRLKNGIMQYADKYGEISCSVTAFNILLERFATDVAEVVRCKDCKHSRSDEFEPLWCYVSETCDPVKEDHFCGYGERK